MKLSKMKKPKKAGVVNLQFGYRGKKESVPFRRGNKIVLPDDPHLDFFQLQKGKQFLIIDSGMVWFGGTDNQVPFFVAMDKEIIPDIFSKELKRLNEKTFYSLLKPRIIKYMEKRFGIVSKRQGYIWAVPIPYTWSDIVFNAFLSFGRTAKVKSARSFSILGTRHRLNGCYVNFADYGANTNDLFYYPGHSTFFAKGIVKAPNYPSMKLEGINVLAQTEWLSSPTETD